MNRNCLTFIFITFVTLILSACGGGERVSKEVFDAVNENMEVKRLTEAEILQEAMIWGDSISSEAQRQLVTALTKAVFENGTVGAIEFCNVNALPILESVSEDYSVSIRRVSNRYRNPKDQPTEDEKMILEAYEYNSGNGLENDPNIQKLDNGLTYLYTKAITIPNAFCLGCHGNSESEIDSETFGKLNELYPDDKATGHKLGDLRGMWSLKIPKSEVVKRM